MQSFHIIFMYSLQPPNKDCTHTNYFSESIPCLDRWNRVHATAKNTEETKKLLSLVPLVDNWGLEALKIPLILYFYL